MPRRYTSWLYGLIQEVLGSSLGSHRIVLKITVRLMLRFRC